MTCWTNPEECPGCQYCDEDSTLTPEQARRIELGGSPNPTDNEKKETDR